MKRIRNSAKRKLGIAAAAVSILLMACGGETAPQRFEGRGVVRRVQPEYGQVLVDHEDIPGFMEAMTMSFDVADRSLLEGVESGQVILFEVEKTSRSVRIVSLEVVTAGDGEPGQGGAPNVAELKEAEDFRLVDHTGKPQRLSDLRGKAVLLDFMFTRCTGPCPILVGTHVALQGRIPAALASRTHFVSVSLDPKHDSPAVLRRYAEKHGIDLANWSLLTGTEQDVQEILDDYAVGSVRDEKGEIDHQVVTYLIDPEGRIAGTYLGLEHEADELERDLVRVLR